jgi:hypothetical protein
MTRMDVKAWRKSANGKAYTIRIGSTWTDKNGVTRLNFDALPLPDEKGQVSCFLEAPRERDDAPAAKGEGRRVDLDDTVPFMMEWR